VKKGEAILKSKRIITTHNLFLGLPAEFHTFFKHSCSLSFNDKPDYDYFYNLFGNLMLREGIQPNMAFDWDVTGKTGWGCVDKSGALQDERGHSPKRVTR
jgi:hypothetical protein